MRARKEQFTNGAETREVSLSNGPTRSYRWGLMLHFEHTGFDAWKAEAWFKSKADAEFCALGLCVECAAEYYAVAHYHGD